MNIYEKAPRYCSITNEPMFEGWCVNDGDMYIKQKPDAIKHAIEAGYEGLGAAFEDDYMYWTDWVDEPEEEWHSPPPPSSSPRFETYTYDVAESLLPYFINDDPSGLSDEELSQCKDFLIDMNNDIEEQGKVFQHFSYETEEGNFTRCEVTGLKAMCHTLIAVAKN